MTPQRSLSTRLLVVLVGLLIPSAGCFHYVAAPERHGPASGDPVRVHLASARSFDVSGFTAHDIGQVEGIFLNGGETGWRVAARALLAPEGNRFDANGFVITIPSAEVQRVEVRRISLWRSAVAGAAAVAAVFLGSEALKGTSRSGDGGQPTDPPTTRALLPVP